MRKALLCVVASLFLTSLAYAAGLDGKWSAEFKPSGKKANAAAKKSAGPVMLNLSSDGKMLTGSVGAGKRSATIQVRQGNWPGAGQIRWQRFASAAPLAVIQHNGRRGRAGPVFVARGSRDDGNVSCRLRQYDDARLISRDRRIEWRRSVDDTSSSRGGPCLRKLA